MKKQFIMLSVLLLLTSMLFTSCGGDNQPSASAGISPSSDNLITNSVTAAPTSGSESASSTSSPSGDSSEPGEQIQVSSGVMLVDFEKEKAGMEFFDLSYYSYEVPEITFATGDLAQSGKGLRMDIAFQQSHGVISMQLDSEAGNMPGGFEQSQDCDYLRMWINNEGDSDVSIAVVLVVSDPLKNGCLNPEGAKLVTVEGEEEPVFTSDAADVNMTNGTGNTSLDIPAGFKGWVYYPLENQVQWWEKTTLSREELINVDTISMDIRFNDATLADYIVIDDICLANPD